VRLKILGGTVPDSQSSLCHTCRSATVIRGARLSEEIISCAQLDDGTRVPFAVTSCSGYSDRSRPSLWHLEDIAWILRSDPKRKQIGFVRSRDLKDDDRHVLDENDYK